MKLDRKMMVVISWMSALLINLRWIQRANHVDLIFRVVFLSLKLTEFFYSVYIYIYIYFYTVSIYIYIYIYMCVCVCVCVCVCGDACKMEFKSK